MKNRIVLILLIAFTNLNEGTCQFESIFGSTYTEWNFIELSCDAAFVETYVQDRDSIIDNVQYKILTDFGLLRESNNNSKLWFRDFDDNSEILIMDLDLVESDTFSINSNQFIVDTIYFEDNVKIIEFDFIPWHCGFYKRLKFQEGKGPNMSFLFAVTGVKENGKLLRCQTKDSMTINYLEEFGYGDDCTKDLVGTSDVITLDFQMNPNPAFEELELIFDSSVKREIRIYDTGGNYILNTSTASLTENLNIHHLPDGIYLLQIIEDKHMKIKKLVKGN